MSLDTHTPLHVPLEYPLNSLLKRVPLVSQEPEIEMTETDIPPLHRVPPQEFGGADVASARLSPSLLQTVLMVSEVMRAIPLLAASIRTKDCP